MKNKEVFEERGRPALKVSRGLVCASILWAGTVGSAVGQTEEIVVNDLSAFLGPPPSWSIVGSVSADLDEENVFEVESGSGVIVNLPSDSVPGQDLFSGFEHGDLDLELEYMMARGSNSGVYLQGRYEVQLLDSWGKSAISFSDNGGIYERWDESQPEGDEGFEGTAAPINASRAPGLWQKMALSFQAPRFDEAGQKTQNARIVRAVLNGVLIHENVELTGPTRGSIGGEAPRGPLRIQGDHGLIALRNIRAVKYEGERPAESGGSANTYSVDAEQTPVFRSFMDFPGGRRATHAVSVSSPDRIHYTYDLNHGTLLQVWRGGFLDAQPMWRDRGDGSSRPLATARYLNTEAALMVAVMGAADEPWSGDSAKNGFRSRGYSLNEENQPTFRYEAHGAAFADEIRPLDGGRGFRRSLSVETPVGNLHARLAEGSSIQEIQSGLYRIGDGGYYIRLDDKEAPEPVIRKVAGRDELIVPLAKEISYSVWF